MPILLSKTIFSGLLALSSLFLVSCSTIKTTSNKAKNIAKSSASSVAKIVPSSINTVTQIIPSSKIPVAKVNADTLKELPTGSERALAYDKKVTAKRFAALNFFNPANYNPPKLPKSNSVGIDEGLLPALTPN